MRKFFALAAGLAMVLGVMAIQPPANASHSLDNVLSSVNGGVDLDYDEDGKANADGDFDGDVECNPDGSNPAHDNDSPAIPGCDDDPDEVCFQGTAQGDRAKFTDVRINGIFTAGTTGVGAWEGELDVGTVHVCVVDSISTPPLDFDGDTNGEVPPIPAFATASLEPASFTTIGVGQNLLSPGNGACLFGNLHGGLAKNRGAALSVAKIQASWTIRQPVAGSCAEPGAFIAASAASVDMEADVIVAPLGLATNGNLPDVVSAQIHTAHQLDIYSLLP